MTKLTIEQIISEVNSRPYSQAFRAEFMEAKLMPHEYIYERLSDHNNYRPSNVSDTNSDDAIDMDGGDDQQTILSEINRLSKLHYSKFERMASPKYLEFVHTCQQQWKGKPFTKAALEFALSVRGMLQSIDDMNGEK